MNLNNLESDLLSLYLKLNPLARGLVVPHFCVETYSAINAKELKSAGFEGVVIGGLFWKDNSSKFDELKSHFGTGNMVLMPKYCGSRGDSESNIKEKEKRYGLKVVKRFLNKPWGIGSLAKMFPEDIESKKIVFIDDDFDGIFMGNSYGMLTIREGSAEGYCDRYRYEPIPSFLNPLTLKSKGYNPPKHELYSPELCDKNLLDQIGVKPSFIPRLFGHDK